MSSIRCENALGTISNIIKVSKTYDKIIVVNDSHKENDPEFKEMPFHCLAGSPETGMMGYQNKLEKDKLSILRKREFSALTNPHNKQVITNFSPKEVSVVGFTLTKDVIETIVSLEGLCTISTHIDCCSDIHSKFVHDGINQLDSMGVRIYGN